MRKPFDRQEVTGVGALLAMGWLTPHAGLYIVLAFLLGSLPWGLWIGHIVRRIDIRDHGSGNLGATNVLRTLGPGWGILTLLLDIGKGWCAVALLPGWLGLGGVGGG